MNPIRSGLALAGLALALGMVACSGTDSMTHGGQGRVRIVMAASNTAPVVAAGTSSGSTTEQSLTAANVTFASILARDLDGKLINVTIDLPITVDVLGLVSGGSFTLPAGFLPPGTYDQLVIVMTKVELTLADGTVVTIDPPGGGWTSVIPVADSFTVTEGQTTSVTIKFRPDRSFSWLGDGWEFHPEFDCDGHDGSDGDHD
jgi:hypothetical protein